MEANRTEILLTPPERWAQVSMAMIHVFNYSESAANDEHL